MNIKVFNFFPREYSVYNFDETISNFEDEVNSFMKDKNIVDIKVTQSDFGNNNAGRIFCLIYTIIYRDM